MPSLGQWLRPDATGHSEGYEEDEMKRTLSAMVVGCSAVLLATGAALVVPAAAPALARGHGGSTTTTTMPTTSTTTTTTAPLSDSGAANCASDGGTESAGVCVLPAATLGQGYETLIASSGGKGPTPFVFNVVAGALPPGLTLPPDYAIGEHGTIIGGTPSAKGSFTFTIQVTDGAGDTATGPFRLTVG
jgi:large repetitive protein